MSVRQPLVLGNDGLPQQLQSGDTIAAPMNTPSIRAVTNGEGAASLSWGIPVYASAADTVKRAQANAKSTVGIIGLVYDTSIASGANGNIAQSGVMVGTTALWDAVVTGQTGGLIFNALYCLYPANPGKLTTSVPVTVGQVNALVGRALSPTELDLTIQPPILL